VQALIHSAIVWIFTYETAVAPNLAGCSVARRITNFYPCESYVVRLAEGRSMVTLPGPVLVLRVEKGLVVEDVNVEEKVYEAEV
jgi:hypothetical protein